MVPVAPAGTVAVKVTAWLSAAGLAEEVNVTVVAPAVTVTVVAGARGDGDRSGGRGVGVVVGMAWCGRCDWIGSDRQIRDRDRRNATDDRRGANDRPAIREGHWTAHSRRHGLSDRLSSAIRLGRV